MKASTRREFLRTTALSLAGLTRCNQPKNRQDFDQLKDITITGAEVIALQLSERVQWNIMRLHTNTGIIGIGEGSSMGTVPDIQEWMKRLLPIIINQNPSAVEQLREQFQALYTPEPRTFVRTYCSIEQAMWDICGKALNKPVMELMGGKRQDKLRLYANINRITRDSMRTPAGFAQNAGTAVQQGFTAVKAAPFDDMPRTDPDRPRSEWKELTRHGINCIKAIRSAIGWEHDLLIDAHNHFSKNYALEIIQELAPYKLFWFEEPIKPPSPDLPEIVKSSAIPIAGGEHIWDTSGFKQLIQSRSLDILMPDVKHCGGINELKKIADLGEAADKPCAPHNVSGPVATAAAAQACAVMPNFLIMEYPWNETPWRGDVIEPPEDIRNGYLNVPAGPGIGAELNDSLIRKYGRIIYALTG